MAQNPFDSPPSSHGLSPPEQTAAIDAVFEALAHSRRRYIIYCLQTYDDPMVLTDLAGKIVEWETERTNEPSDAAIKRVYTSLYHTHLPKLTDAALVTYNRDTDMVELAESADRFVHLQNCPLE